MDKILLVTTITWEAAVVTLESNPSEEAAQIGAKRTQIQRRQNTKSTL